MKTTSYVYLLGWSKLSKFYYGARYAKGATPTDLWVTYFTSSKAVKEFSDANGNPDIISVRRTFATPVEARLWESKVLDRIDAARHPMMLNKRNGSWKWATYEITPEGRKAISDRMKGKPKSPESISKRLVTMKGFKQTLETRQKISRAHTGKPRPDSYTQKMKNKIWINNGKITQRCNSTSEIPDGWVEGRIHTWNRPPSPLYKITNILTHETIQATRDQFCKLNGYKTANIPTIDINRPTCKYKHWIIESS